MKWKNVSLPFCGLGDGTPLSEFCNYFTNIRPRFNHTTQPYYIVDHRRRSTRFELDAIDSITKAVTNEDIERGNRLFYYQVAKEQ